MNILIINGPNMNLLGLREPEIYGSTTYEGIPAAEVHISDPDAREDFRRVNFLRPVCAVSVAGKGVSGYEEAMEILQNRLRG